MMEWKVGHQVYCLRNGEEMMEWKVGQQVYCLRNGEGKIVDTECTTEFPIVLENIKGVFYYTRDGRITPYDATPMLYPSKPEIILPKWQPKPGEWCWFWDEKLYGAFLSKFEKMQDDVFFDWEGNCWQNCAPFVGELLPHLKEVKP
jgi:hypothetical protein